jgi:hypothetical protein
MRGDRDLVPGSITQVFARDVRLDPRVWRKPKPPLAVKAEAPGIGIEPRTWFLDAR